MNRVPYRVFKNEHLEQCAHREYPNPNKYLAGNFVTGVTEAEGFTVTSFGPNFTNQSRVFTLNVEFSEAVNQESLPFRIGTEAIESVTASWVAQNEEGTLFQVTVGDLANELPNNTNALFDFTNTESPQGEQISGQLVFPVAINYPT